MKGLGKSAAAGGLWLGAALACLGAALHFWLLPVGRSTVALPYGLTALAGLLAFFFGPAAGPTALGLARRRTLRALPVLAAAWAFFFFVTAGTYDSSTLKLYSEADHPYAMMAEGFRQGKLSLSVDPSPALLALKDPYDPEANAKLRFHDLCLYQGRYYMQHGPLPALALYLPLRLLTGGYPDSLFVVGFFMFSGFLALYATLCRIKDRHFQDLDEAWVFLGGLTLGLGSGGAYLMTRPQFYEACIAASFAFSSLAFYALHRALVDQASAGWLAASSSLLALAATGRINMIMAVIAFVAGLSLWLCLQRDGEGRRLPQRFWLALWLPALAVGLGWAWFNQARFGDFLEFGNRYQLASFRSGALIERGQWLSTMGCNLQVYFLHPFYLTAKFPFVGTPWGRMVFPAPSPYHAEDFIGFFCYWPAAWMLCTLPGSWALARAGDPGRQFSALGIFMAAQTAVVAALLLVLFAIAGATFRYAADYLGLLLLLWWCAAMLLLRLPRWGRLAGGLYIGSALSGLCLSLFVGLGGPHGSFAKTLPALAAFFDRGPR